MALGEAGRTPLIEPTAAGGKRSTRLAVIAALRLAFPDEVALFWEQIQDDDGYAAVERFVTDKLGVTLTDPRPPYLTEQGAPY